ncbi:hypothetical protein Taro_054759 [Colocasia esculenta]|uniref:Uncharacterized protein n=1 Tax=Colocasia esculenta TaxID=4460 RepID=A0A843XPJ4_COLES|nr:hypothetical protein [Colocasia esculenta]
MWHPGGRPSCWCRNRRARRDTRGGVAPVGHDLIAAQEVVAIRFSGRAVCASVGHGPSGGFQKGCRACLCLLDLSWLRASGAVFCGGCHASSLFARC